MADLSWVDDLVMKFVHLFPSSSTLSPRQQPCEDLPSSSSSLTPGVDLKALTRMVAKVKAALKDAEETQVREDSLRLWLKDLRDIAHEGDDLLDECHYEYLRAKVETGIQSGEATVRLPHEVRNVLSTPALHTSFLHKIADRIQKIRGKLAEISKLRDALQLREGDRQRHSLDITRRPPSSHLMDVPNPQGRKDDLEKVIGMLLSDECTKSNLFVIPIVGIGGVGKTTLAQLVYNNSEVRRLFQLQGWVSVCDDFDLVTLTRKICQSLDKAEQNLDELSALQEMLINKIKGKRFLLILDDVWNENSHFWNMLLLPLKHGKHGSAVITTTRSERVATIVAPTHTHHHLGCLSTIDCWEVLKQTAFHGQDVHENYHKLIGIGKQIAKKCKGLPLAAKSLGCLLSQCDCDADRWRDVLESDVWDVDDKIIPALMLSYVYLPSHLKQCFLYASLFPKASVFSKDDLVRLWMAQGFVHHARGKELEDVGNWYFDELLKRSFFQSNRHDPSLFMMHDLSHDLAQYVSHGEHFVMEGGKANSFPIQEARHLLLYGIYSSSICDTLHLAPESVRTFLALPPIHRQSQGDLLAFITEMMPRLRVLSLRGPGFYRLPKAIGNLKHLRYLSVENIELRELPDSVGKLYHLQTLIIKGITELQGLPKGITNLINLQCLVVGSSFTQMPKGFGKLTSLRTLDVFNVGEVSERCAGLEELKNLIHLRGSLIINNLEYIEDAEKAKEANLQGKRKIWDLELNWHCHGRAPESMSHDQQKQVLENLCPHLGLRHLTLRNYRGLTFPEWLTYPLFCDLAVVEIICPELIALPPFGQLPSLRRLEIRKGVTLQVVGSEFRGRDIVGFPALEELVFEDMSCWMEWQGVRRGDFPRLRRLVFEKCPQLKLMVPLYNLPALEELVLQHCEKLQFIELQSTLPPLKLMGIQACPVARFSPKDDEQLLLPSTFHYLLIDYDCPLLVEWCQTDAGVRSLSRIPGAKLWKDPNGCLFVSTDDHGDYEVVSVDTRP